MSKSVREIGVLLALFIFGAWLSDGALARDLSSAATSAVSSAKTIARILSVFGILVGGGLMQLPGLSDFGKRTLAGGVIGCVCSFGGPAFVSFMQGIFGTA